MTEKLINRPDEFPRVAIYERQGNGGPIYRVAFYNKEFVRGWEAAPRSLVAIVAGVLFPIVMAFAVITTENMGVSWVTGAAVCLVLYFILFANLWKAAQSERAIELDNGADRLRVLKSGRVQLERPLSALVNLTVEPHPEAESKRQIRQEAGNKKLTEEERSHCLFGWFGPGGAEKVLLITRAEWPNLQTLFEVRQAVLWARDLKPEAGERKASEGGGGINPPLD